MAALLAVKQTEGDQAAITEIANLNQSQKLCDKYFQFVYKLGVVRSHHPLNIFKN